MNKREELFTQVIGTKTLVDMVAATIQNPTEDLDWETVESMKESLETLRDRINNYIAQVEEHLLDNTPKWSEQWDIAFKLFDEWNQAHDVYNPDDIIIETLAAEFEAGGIDPKLAVIMATKIKHPQLG